MQNARKSKDQEDIRIPLQQRMLRQPQDFVCKKIDGSVSILLMP